MTSRRSESHHIDLHDLEFMTECPLVYITSPRPTSRPRGARSPYRAGCTAQYTSIALTTRLAKIGIVASMGTVGDSYDTAPAENMRSGVKTERLRRRELATRADAERDLFDYIDGFYSTRRIQKKPGWRSPDEYEAAYWNGEDLTIPDTTRPPTAGTPPTKGLSSVAQPDRATGDKAADTAGVPLGAAGSAAKTPGSRTTSERGEPRPRRTPSPRERRGTGRSPDEPPTTRRTTTERPNTRQRTLTTRSQPRPGPQRLRATGGNSGSPRRTNTPSCPYTEAASTPPCASGFPPSTPG